MLLHSSSTSWTCTFPRHFHDSLSLLCKHHEFTRHYSTAYKYLSLHLKPIAIDPHNSAERQLSEPLDCSSHSIKHFSHNVADPKRFLRRTKDERLRSFLPRHLGPPLPGLVDHAIDRPVAAPVGRVEGGRAVCKHADRLEGAHVFQADLPGMRKDKVRVEVEEGRVLSISGERRRGKEEVTDTWHRLERGSGRFSRRFRLPEDVRVDQVRATMENGVLTVAVPKVAAAAARPDVKPIPITG